MMAVALLFGVPGSGVVVVAAAVFVSVGAVPGVVTVMVMVFVPPTANGPKVQTTAAV